MKLTAHATADSFLEVTQDWLVREEAANNLMLGLALRLKRAPVPCYLLTLSDDVSLALAALMTPPFPVTLFSPREAPEEALEEALELLAHHLQDTGAPVSGTSGRENLAERFARCWAGLTGRQYGQTMRMRVYQLREVTQPPARLGRFRVAEERDTQLLTEWMRAFLEEALHGENVDAAGEMTRNRIRDGELFVWDVDGQPVSMAASTRPLIKGITVNMVYTPPALRSKGYASVCVAALSQHLLDKGREYCTLFTDLDNPTSNSIYQKIGYRPVCDFNQYSFSG